MLIGGYVDNGVTDSWEWDGAAWTRAVDGPAVFHAAAAYDADANRILVFGGFDPDKRSANLWQRTPAGWSLVAAANESNESNEPNGLNESNEPNKSNEPSRRSGPGERAEHRGAWVPGVGFVVFGGIAGQGMSLEERMLAKRNDLWTFTGATWRPLDK